MVVANREQHVGQTSSSVQQKMLFERTLAPAYNVFAADDVQGFNQTVGVSLLGRLVEGSALREDLIEDKPSSFMLDSLGEMSLLCRFYGRAEDSI